MCPPVRAHWRHLANTIELMLPSARVHNPIGKSIGSAFLCTAHGKVSSGMPGHVLSSNNCPIHMGDLSPIQYMLSSRVHNPNGISIRSAIFAQMTAGCPYTLQWDALPSKLSLPMGIWTPSNRPPTWFLGRYCRAHDRDRRTDRQTTQH